MAEYNVAIQFYSTTGMGLHQNPRNRNYDTDASNASGIIVEKNADRTSLKIRIVEDCDKRGVIYYDNKDHLIINKRNKR
jgi:hypothetical protein